jgi:hypothetical protein
MGRAPLNPPADALEAEAVQEFAYREFHVNCTLWPRFIDMARTGLEKFTVGIVFVPPPPYLPEPQPASPLSNADRITIANHPS